MGSLLFLSTQSRLSSEGANKSILKAGTNLVEKASLNTFGGTPWWFSVRPHASTVEDRGWIPDPGTKIPHVVQKQTNEQRSTQNLWVGWGCTMKPFPVILEKSRENILEKAIPFPFWECSSHVCLCLYIHWYHSTHQYLATGPKVCSDSRKTSTSSSFAHTALSPGTSELFWALYLFTLKSVSSPLSSFLVFPPLSFSLLSPFPTQKVFSFFFFQVRQTVKTKEILFLEGKNVTFYVHVCMLSCVQLFATPWTLTH